MWPRCDVGGVYVEGRGLIGCRWDLCGGAWSEEADGAYWVGVACKRGVAWAGGRGCPWPTQLSRTPPCPQFHCCGSNNSYDWRDSLWVRSEVAEGRVVPDSCCKTVVPRCGLRDHASNIYKVEVGGCRPAADICWLD